MKLVSSVRYRLNFEKKGLTGSASLMGVGFFLQALYFFGFGYALTADTSVLVQYLIIPMFLEAAWCMMLRGFYFDGPGLYGILGTLFCLLLTVQTVLSGNILGAVLAILTVLPAAASLLAITGGYLKTRLPGMAIFLLVIGVHLLLCRTQPLLLEIASLCPMLSIFLFFMGLEVMPEDDEI